MKGAELGWFTIGVGITLLGAGYVLGASLTNIRWRRATGCRLEYHEIAATNWYEAVRLDKEGR